MSVDIYRTTDATKKAMGVHQLRWRTLDVIVINAYDYRVHSAPVNIARAFDPCLHTCIEVVKHYRNCTNGRQKYVKTSRFPRASVLLDDMECGMLRVRQGLHWV